MSLTQEEKRIKIAEARGWKIESYGPSTHPNLYWLLRKPDGTIRQEGCTGEAWSREVFGYMMPNYFRDLNAMHEAEMGMDDITYGEYLVQLEFVAYQKGQSSVQQDRGKHSATAAQRAEAFGLTLGLWKGGSDE